MQTKQGGSNREKGTGGIFCCGKFHLEELAEKLTQVFETRCWKQMCYSQNNQLHFKLYNFPSAKQAQH